MSSKNPLKIIKTAFILFIIAFVLLFVIIIVMNIVKSRRPSQPEIEEAVVLEYWGIFESDTVMIPLIEQYQVENPNVTINYSQKKFDNDLFRYKEQLLTRLKQGTGPDIFRAHSTWMSEFVSELSFFNASILPHEFKERFYGVAQDQCFTLKEEILCIPVMYDGLALFYNEDMFEKERITEPKTWDDLVFVAQRLTKKDEEENIQIAGITLGSGENVEYSSDILALMFAQSGVEIPDGLESKEAIDALKFYTDFVNKYGVWNQNMQNSQAAFASQRAAMTFGKVQDLEEIRKVNPTLRIGVLPVPQVPTAYGNTTQNTWASFWAESVSADSTEVEQAAAWAFIEWLTQPEQQIVLYQNSKEINAIGTIPSNTSLYDNFKKISHIGPILIQAPTSVTGIVADRSGNDDYADIFKNLIDKNLNGSVKAEYMEESLLEAKEAYTKLQK